MTYGEWAMPLLPAGEPWMRAIDPITGEAVEAIEEVPGNDSPDSGNPQLEPLPDLSSP